MPSHWGLDFNVWILKGHKHSVCNRITCLCPPHHQSSLLCSPFSLVSSSPLIPYSVSTLVSHTVLSHQSHNLNCDFFQVPKDHLKIVNRKILGFDEGTFDERNKIITVVIPPVYNIRNYSLGRCLYPFLLIIFCSIHNIISSLKLTTYISPLLSLVCRWRLARA